MNNPEKKENYELDLLSTKNKRDQYLYDIRKGKVNDMIQRKRLKLASYADKTQQNSNDVFRSPLTNLNPTGSASANSESKEDHPSFAELTDKFFTAMNNQDYPEVFKVVQAIRFSLSTNDSPPLDEFLETGLPSHIVKFLDSSYENRPDIQYEALWIITNCFAGNAQHTNKILTKDLLRRIFDLIWHPKAEIVEIVF